MKQIRTIRNVSAGQVVHQTFSVTPEGVRKFNTYVKAVQNRSAKNSQTTILRAARTILK